MSLKEAIEEHWQVLIVLKHVIVRNTKPQRSGKTLILKVKIIQITLEKSSV
jgi:hypothetical protein